MALTSPGVEVTIINESFYVPSDAGTTPLIIVATAKDKTNGAGTAIASGTKSANANTVFLISSQRELTETFGDPKFYTDASNNSLHGYELNEYGLQAAYSFLGIANRAFVLRANVDLGQLVSSATAPEAAPTNGTYWLDVNSTVPGIFEWSATDQSFTTITPINITSLDDLVGGVATGIPLASIGTLGQYAINYTHNTNKIYKKTASNTWVQLGSADWKSAVGGIAKFLQASHINRPLWKTAEENRPTGSVWFKTTTPNAGADVSVKLYNSASKSFTVVDAPLYANNHAAIYALDPSQGGLGITAGKLYTQFNITEQNLRNAEDTTDALGDFTVFRYEGGKTVITSKTAGATFTAGHSIKIAESLVGQSTLEEQSETVTLGGTANTDFVAAINGAGFVNLVAEITTDNFIKITHTKGGEFRMFDVASGTALANAGFGSANAHDYGTYTANSSTKVDNLYIVPGGFTEDSTKPATVMATNFKRLSYTASVTAPSNEPADGTLWYNTNTDADILVHNGSTFVGYRHSTSPYYDASEDMRTDPNGPQITATKPTTQSDGTALRNGDLWIDSSDLENYPKLYRYDTSLTDGADFVLIDKKDQTTENGILFADARYNKASTRLDSNTTGGVGVAASIKDLLTDTFLDPDAPDSALFPKGIMLWNTRRSGFNVKEYKNNHIITAKYPGSGASGKGNTRYAAGSNESVSTYFKDRWVTKNANNEDGSGTFGRKAVRKVVVQQLKADIRTNQAIREDQRGFNIIACPGYTEVTSDMISLNADRNYTAFVVGDTPLRLASTATALTNWANNSANASDNGEDGLVSSSEYMGVFYPPGRTTDNSGKSIVVPPSHMILRVLANNDNVGFPWFAPAGTRRGVVDNATAVGYIDSVTGEFQTVSLTESVRDSMHTAKINPITFFSGTGIVNFGNLTKATGSSALDRINVSRLTVYLRTQLDKIGKPFIFEPNDTLTRNEIKSAIESFLLELVGQRALYDFLVVCDETNNTAARIDRNELYVDIAIEPVKSVEFIYIPLRIKNTGEIAKLGV